MFRTVKNLIRLYLRFRQIRDLARQLKTPEDVKAWQARMLGLWLKDQAKHLSHFRPYADQPLESWPIMDKSALMSSFGHYNRAGISTGAAWSMFDGRTRPRSGYYVGGSTGTSGNRGLYVITENERMDWLGVTLAKTLPRFPADSARIALLLPNYSPLYKFPRYGPIEIKFFDLNTDLRVLKPQIEAFAPDTLIAPPKVLRWLAEQEAKLTLERVFSGAEVLDAKDREVIEARFGVTLREIYMASEGLLGVACEQGTLHLCEDVVKFEFEPVPGTDLVNPLITDFTRVVQAMVRYRMNDLLRLSPKPCACGSPLQAVLNVEGRIDDVFELRDASGQPQTLTPDVLRNAVIDADRQIGDFRLKQVGAEKLELLLPKGLNTEVMHKARAALSDLLDRRGLIAEVTVKRTELPIGVRKLRRVERVWRAEAVRNGQDR